MILTLEASSATGRELPAPRSMVFRERGGTIGRTTGNDWVLPDPYVSSRHARIVYEHGVFFVEDTSTNGVFLNSADRRVGRGHRAELSEGDIILIEPYEIRVFLEAGESAAAPGGLSDDPFGMPEPASVDPLQLFGGANAPAKAPASDARGLANKPVISDSFKPPAVVGPPPSAGGLIPTDYDPMNSSRMPRPAVEPQDRTPPSVERMAAVPPASEAAHQEPAKRRAATEPPPASRPAGGFADVLEGAGLGEFPVSPEVAREFGQILRVVVTGLMDVLNSRQQLKQEFRLPVTTVQASENNPLKFSANVEDALHNLLVKRNPAYLGPLPAFEDAFADVRLHQMAMLHGVRAAFESMLKEFDPDRLQKEFDRKSKGSVMPGKLRYWDQYRERFGDMVSDADACFRDLFGDEFATAYEDQLSALKADSKGGAKGGGSGRRRPRS